MIFTYETEVAGNVQLQQGNVMTTTVEADSPFYAVEGAKLWIKNLATTLEGTAARLVPHATEDGAVVYVKVYHADYAKVVRSPGWETKYDLKRNDKGGHFIARLVIDLSTYELSDFR